MILSKVDSKDNVDAINYIQSNEKLITTPGRLKISTLLNDSTFKLNTSPTIAYLDKEKLIFPLMIRKWKKSDFFCPLGMNKRKKLSDFFIDQKISLFQKENIYVLLSENNIVWVIGYRIDNRYKITDATKNILMIEYLNQLL